MAITREIPSNRAGVGIAANPADMAESVERISANAARWGIYSAVAIVPLLIVSPDVMFGYADVPKVAAARTLAGVVAASSTVNIAASLWRTGKTGVTLTGGRWLIAAVLIYLLANIASTVLSISPSGSLNGAYPGFDGTDLYSLISYSVLGIAAAAYIKVRRHFMSLLMALAISGALAGAYGALQFFGIDPLGFDRFEVNSQRTPLTFGNPGFAGSFLAISLFATAGLFLSGVRSSNRINFALWGMFALQAFALGAAASRGSWVGVTAGAVVFAALTLLTRQRGRIWPRLALLVLPFAVTVAALAMFSSGGSADQPAERLQSINTELVSGGLNGRLTMWWASIDLIVDRPWTDDGSSGKALRSLFGYGPDTFRYAYQQVVPDEHVARFVPHAHNNVLNTAVELGVVGLLAWIAMSTLVVFVGVRIAIASSNVFWVKVIASTLTAAYVAHSVEQLANVPRAADSIAIWAITGAVIALWPYTKRSSQDIDANDTENLENPKLAPIGPAFAFPLLAGIIAITIAGNLGHVRADFEAASLQSRMLEGAAVSDLASTAGNSSSLAPDVPYYSALEAMALDSAVAVVSPGSPILSQLTDDSLEARRSAAKSGILPGEQFALARALYSNAGSDTAMMREAVTEYERLIELTPRYWAAWLEMAAAYGRVERVEEGRDALRTASELLRKQPSITRDDPVTISNFDAVHGILGIEPGTYFP